MFFVYIVASQRDGILYVGHTDDLQFRIEEHRIGALAGFSKKNKCTELVWFELHETRDSAFRRERQIKEWQRAWKIRRIEKLNPYWDDLFPNMSEEILYDERRIYVPNKL